MRIGLNATCFDSTPSGANARFQTLFPRIVARMPEAEFLLYQPANHDIAGRFRDAPNLRVVPTPLQAGTRLRKALRGRLWWPQRLRADRLDILECFNLPAVANPIGATLLTLHDIRRAHLPRWTPERLAYDAAVRAALRRVDHVITVSAAMRDEIAATYAPRSIGIIHNCIDPGRFDAAARAAWPAMRQRMRLPEHFLLAVGHLEPRKNHLRLLEAVAQLKHSGARVFLLIAGRDSGQKATLLARIAALEIANSVRIETDIGDDDLSCLYMNAAAVVFPSLYEGFGLPVIEAMAAGSPLALSDIPAFREISPAGGLFFDPASPDAIAHALDTILREPRLAAQIAAYGRRRAADFSADALAAAYADLYRQFLPAGNAPEKA